LVREWWQKAELLAGIKHTERLGWHNLRRKFVNDLKADTPLADLAHLGGWKSAMTVITVYQQPDETTMRRAGLGKARRAPSRGWQIDRESTAPIDSRPPDP
jgi:hypothetical protein